MAGVWRAHPGFEVEPGSITLDEIERRANAFDPLTLHVDPEVRAVSPHAWVSLGSKGLALHFFRSKGARSKGRLSEMLVTTGRDERGRRWKVRLDGKQVARFSRVEEAVEACDYEVRRLGAVARESALPSAGWRRQPSPDGAGPWGEARARQAFAAHGPKGRVGGRFRG